VLRYTGEAVPELTLALEVDEERAYVATSATSDFFGFPTAEWIGYRRISKDLSHALASNCYELLHKVF
jgi:hypothetical protein